MKVNRKQKEKITMTIMMRSMIIITLSNMIINMNAAINKITEKEVLTIFIDIFILLGFNFDAFNE